MTAQIDDGGGPLTIADLEAALFAAFPSEHAESWDHVGRSVGDPDTPVERVMCALDATEANVVRAAEAGANVLVAHHPVFLGAPAAFGPRPSAENPQSAAALYGAARRGIAIISMHTNLDRSLEARQALCERLGLHALSSIEYPDAPERCGLGALADAEPIALEALSRRAAHAFSTVPRIWGAPDAMVSRIAVLGGSLGDLGELAMKAGAQAIVCGEAGYHVCQDLAARGCAVVLLGHDASELPFAEVLARTVCASGVPTDAVTVMGERRQWWSLDEGALHDNR